MRCAADRKTHLISLNLLTSATTNACAAIEGNGKQRNWVKCTN